MKVVVGTTPVRLDVPPDARPVVQNLGPGIVYFEGGNAAVNADSGMQLPVNAVYEWPGDLNIAGGSVYLVSDTADTDVRVLVVG